MNASKLALVAVGVLAQLAAACVVRNDPPPSRDYGPSGGASSSSSSSSGGSSGSTSGGPSSATPILVDIDTDKTMNAAPGEGVGVFVEYASGGHWHIWWTCDTNVNPGGPVTCDFSVHANITKGTITLKSDAPAGTSRLLPSGQELDLDTTTGAEVHGFTFDTDPGAVVTLEATIGGQRDGRYFFFVQNGQVNGGFSGTLTDPLMLEGTKP
jgi:hypothetical protein